MSFGFPGGHVPVGTGQQVPYPYGYQPTPAPALVFFDPNAPVVLAYQPPQPEPVVLVIETPPALGVNAVTVYRDGHPARQIPPHARHAMRARVPEHHPVRPVVTVQAQHYADARQIPGSSSVYHPGQRRGY